MFFGLFSCMTYSLFDHPHFQSLLVVDDLAALFKAHAELQAMLAFEAALADAEADVGLIPKAAALAISDAISAHEPDALQQAAFVARDGLVVPGLIKELRSRLDQPHRPHLHVGATSQDVIDTGLMIRLKQAFALLADRLRAVIAELDTHAATYGDQPLMAKTRMQQALPIRLADRLAGWTTPLVDHLRDLEGLQDHVLAVQLAGPVGTLDALGDKGPDIRARLAQSLGLADPGGSWHTDRSRIADIAHWLSKVSGSLGKIGQDVVLMAQNEVGEATIDAGGLSSAMPHKKNPVLAEILVTLARYNAGQLSLIHQAMIHENERSGSAWTLEWMVLPSMVATVGGALKVTSDMLGTLSFPQN